MSVTINLKPLVDLPIWQQLQFLPVSSILGMSMCNYKKGYSAVHSRYVYYLASATSFWRYDTVANSWQQLANPPGGTVGAGTTLTYDPSAGTAGKVWALISNGTAAPTFQVYDCALNTWTARSVTNLPATFGTDAVLTHTCSTYDVAGNDDYIYLIGNNATVFYRYSISGNSWISTLTAVTAAPGAGCALIWTPGWNTNRIVCIRGGATATVYYYQITENNWTPITYIPATETFSTGTMAAHKIGSDSIYIQKDITGRIYKLDLTNSILRPVTTLTKVTMGTAIVGDRLLHTESEDGVPYIYLGQHTGPYFFRVGLFTGIS